MDLFKKQIFCRGCLGTKNLKKIGNSDIQRTFRLLSGDQVHETLPYIFCYLCRAQLLKLQRFRERCQNSAELLNKALKHQRYDILKNDVPSTFVQTFPETIEYSENTQTSFVTEVYIEVEQKELNETNLKIENEPNDFYLKNELVDHDYANDIELSEGTGGLNLESQQLDTLEVKDPDINLKNNQEITDTESHNDGNTRVRKKKFKDKFKQIGKFFETKQNIENFESTYDVDVIILSTEEQYNEILKRKNGFSYPFKCNLCYKSYMDDDNLQKHIKKLHDLSRGNEVCDICKTRYKDKKMLKRHMKIHRLKFACRQCKHVSVLSSLAVEHYNMHRGQLYECQNCDKTYDKQTTYLAHIRLSHPSECIWCELCGESYVSETGLRGHHNLVHKEVKYSSNAKCRICDTHFLNKDACRRHSVSCDKSSNMFEASCVHCGENFDKKLSLRDHLLEQHGNKNKDKYYSCTKCKKTFKRASRYGAHYKRVHGGQLLPTHTVICELCGKKLPNTTVLRYHMSAHTGNKPHQCPDCPKSFVKQSSLKSHSIVHTGERGYACELCPKTFKWRSGLRTHQLTVHSGVKLARRKKQPERTIASIF